MLFDGKHILITGGTGSLGKALLRRLLEGKDGHPARIVILSRDEAKQSDLRAHLGSNCPVEFRIGDVRSYEAVTRAMEGVDIVFNAAALKQVPSCEYFPYEAVQTNIQGPQNIIECIHRCHRQVQTVVGISTDKACKPVNVMGMTKAIQERQFLSAQIESLHTRFVCVRYGNVLASRGSVIPLFQEQIKAGGPVTLTTKDMTRFLLTLDQAVDTVFDAVDTGISGETFIPRIPSARVADIASIMVGNRPIEIKVTGIRPGEKVHEILISEEEIPRTCKRGKYYVIGSVLTKLNYGPGALSGEYSSADSPMHWVKVEQLLSENGFLDD